jgi:type I restriction enzyme, S subunit
MTQHRVEPLGSLCDILDSRRKPVTKRDRISGEYPYYGATGIVDYVEHYICDEPLVLVGEDGAKWEAGENTAFPVDGRCWINNHAHVLRPHRDSVLDKWIIYYLNASDLSPFITGLTVPKLNQEKLREIPIPLPPLPEQKRIVAILDQAFEGINTAVANTEKNLANTRELFDNYLDSVFVQPREGWVQKRLGVVAAFKNGLNFTKGSKGEIIKIVGVKDFQENFYVPTSQLETAQIDGRLSADYELRVGDILTVRSNGNKQLIGRCILASEVPEKTSHSGFTIRIRTASKEISPAYLVHFLKSKASREKLIESGDGTNIASLNQQALSALPVTLPPIADQLAIADRIEAIAAEIKNLEAIYQQKLDRLADLKQAILQKAFAGDLTNHPERALPEAAE